LTTVSDRLRLDYIRGEYLRTVWECARETQPEVARLLERRFGMNFENIVGDGWYSLKPVKGLFRDFETVCTEDEFEHLIRRVTGRTIVGRYIPVFTTPRTALKMIPRKLNEIFIGEINVSVRLDTPGRRARVNVPPHDMGRYFCCAIKGGLLGIMDGIRARAEVHEEKCIHREHPHCTFRVEW
jgi:hypothetical protein